MGLRPLPQHMPRQEQDILSTVAQGRQLEEHHRQAMIQVRAEAACRDLQAQILRGGRDELDIQVAIRDRAQAPHAFRLDGTQELALERQRQRADLIQEQRAL